MALSRIEELGDALLAAQKSEPLLHEQRARRLAREQMARKALPGDGRLPRLLGNDRRIDGEPTRVRGYRE